MPQTTTRFQTPGTGNWERERPCRCVVSLLLTSEMGIQGPGLGIFRATHLIGQTIPANTSNVNSGGVLRQEKQKTERLSATKSMCYLKGVKRSDLKLQSFVA